MGKGGGTEISQSERGKRLLEIGSEREDKLLRRSHVRYLKGINGVWMGKKAWKLGSCLS